MEGKRVGNFINQRRKELGFTIEQLAAEVGVPRYLVEEWSEGVLPEIKYLLPLAKALESNVEELLKGKEDIPSEVEKKETPILQSADDLKTEDIPKKEEKGYYEKLNEKIAKTDYTDYQSLPRGSNGFFDGEYRFGQILCVLFLVIILFVNGLNLYNWAFRPRELTEENYSRFLEVKVSAIGHTNITAYEVKLTSKKDSYPIYNLSLSVEVEFKAIMPEYHPYEYPKELVRVANFEADELLAGESLTVTVSLPYHMYHQTEERAILVKGEL